MRIQACLLAALLAPAPADIDTARLALAFRDVSFGAAPAEVEAKLAMLKVLQRGEDTLAFAGTLDARAVQLHAFFTPKTRQLWKVGVVYLQPLGRPFEELEAAWQREWERLAATLGQPTRRLSLFKTPVGAGGELAALKAGDGQFSAVWQLEDGYVACDISRFGNLTVGYEHAALAALDDEERAAATPRPASKPEPRQPEPAKPAPKKP